MRRSPPDEHDRRRPPKERVLGSPRDNGFGMAYPFTLFQDQGELVVVHDDVQGSSSVAVFWSTAAEMAIAFLPSVDGQALTFEVRDAGFFDVESGSEWNLQGWAIRWAPAQKRTGQPTRADRFFLRLGLSSPEGSGQLMSQKSGTLYGSLPRPCAALAADRLVPFTDCSLCGYGNRLGIMPLFRLSGPAIRVGIPVRR